MRSALALALLVAAADPAKPPPAAGASAIPATADPDAVSVPPGSPADVALWRRAYDIDNELPIERSIATRLQLQLKNARLVERLAAQRARGDAKHADHERAEHAEKRLRAAVRENVELLTSQWPVDPTRVCGYDLLNFESVLRSDENPRKAAQLAQTGDALRECVARAELPLAKLQASNERLRQAIAGAEQALATSKDPASAAR